MTQAEFNTHYKEYIHSFNEKYRHLDLNFDTIMLMKGVSKEEFNELIKHVHDPIISKTQDNVSENGDEDWIDGVDEYSSKKRMDYNQWVDEPNDEYDSWNGGDSMD